MAKVRVTMKANVYKVISKEIESRNAGEAPIKWYQMVVDQGEDVATVTCTEKVAQKVQGGNSYDLSCEYDTENKKFKIVDTVLPYEAAPQETPFDVDSDKKSGKK